MGGSCWTQRNGRRLRRLGPVWKRGTRRNSRAPRFISTASHWIVISKTPPPLRNITYNLADVVWCNSSHLPDKRQSESHRAEQNCFVLSDTELKAEHAKPYHDSCRMSFDARCQARNHGTRPLGTRLAG